MSQAVREEVLKLMKQKDRIEDEIKQLTAILTQNGVGMNDSLVDEEGFPLNSIDVYQVRHARHRIICLQNDHKSVMKQIEYGLQGYYSTNTNSHASSAADNIQDVEMRTASEPRPNYVVPFARVTMVSPRSPAESAGLCSGDQIVEFGSVNHTNFKNITDIAVVVQHSEGFAIHVKLKRDNGFVTTQLVPRKWLGRGLLGCNIDSII